jgi:hypothetical protein
VNADGSFDIELDASLDDAFEVRVVHDGKRSAPIYVVRGGAAVGQGDDGSLSCEQRVELASEVISLAAQAADRSCTNDSDCRRVELIRECASGCPALVSVSGMGESQLASAAEALADGLCANFTEDGCTRTRLPCPSGPMGMACIDGQCTGTPLQMEPSPDCEECLQGSISWRIVSPGILPALPANEVYRIDNCNRFSITALTGSSSCSRELSQCGGAANGIRALNEALAQPDVMQAHTSQRDIIQGEPAERSGFVYEITIDGQSFQYRTCAGTPGVMCNVAPEIQALIDLLNAIRSENRCTLVRPPGGDCESAFDAGDGDAAIRAYWHDPETKSCMLRIFGGSGGNDNRYESAEACEAACPPPTSADDCPSGWSLIEEACLECGPVGGCMRSAARCTKPCEDDEDCAYDMLAGPGAHCQDDGLCSSSTLCF